MHIEFLVEDSSGARLLEELLPRLIGEHSYPHTWHVHPYKGIGRIPKNLKSGADASKRILLDQLPRILRGYAKTPGIDAVVVLVDSDRKDCEAFLAELKEVATRCGLPGTMFRIAIEEIEAWYLADRAAIESSYRTAKVKLLNSYVQDAICGTWELLADIVYPGGSKAVLKAGWPLPGQLKHEWAERIGPQLDIENTTSPSFRKFRDGVRRIAQQGAG